MPHLRRLLAPLAACLALTLTGAGSLAVARGDGSHDTSRADHGMRHDADHGCGRDHYSAWDEQWLMMSIEGDRFEIQGGELAQRNATTDKVRALGERLVKDHSESLEDATDLAERLGIDVPDSPSPTQQWELRAVEQFQGRDFDHWYADLEVQDHKQDIQEAQDEIDKGCNPDIRDEAKSELPVLQEHLRLAEEALESVS
jgi:putative membrane protein